MSTTTELRCRLMASGYSPIPCDGKRPVLKAWEKKTKTNVGEIKLWEKTYSSAANTGILTRLVPTLDIDITDSDATEAVEDLARVRFEEHGRFLVRTGKAPKRAIPFRTDKPFPKIVRNLTAPNGSTHKIEILCDGQQVIAFGEHPDTKQPYGWHGGEPGVVRLDELPFVSHDDMMKFVDDAVELLVKEHGYKVAATSKSETGNGEDHDAGNHTEWSVLIDNLRNGHDLHESSIKLAAKMITSGMSNGAVVNMLRGIFISSNMPHDARWQERYDDLGRCVKTARDRFGESKQQPVEVMPESQWFGEKPATAPPQLIKGVLPQTGVAIIGGQSGGGKTFQAIHLAAYLMPDCGQKFYIDKYRLKRQGGVLYFVLEGKARIPSACQYSVRCRVEQADGIWRQGQAAVRVEHLCAQPV